MGGNVPPMKKRPSARPGTKPFRCGDSGRFRSLGEIGITASIDALGRASGETATPPAILPAGIVWATIALFISREALRSGSGMLDFKNNELAISNRLAIRLDIAPIGHMLLPTKPPDDNTGCMEDSIWMQKEGVRGSFENYRPEITPATPPLGSS